MNINKQQGKYLEVAKSIVKGRYLIARTTIPIYTPIAWFGPKRVNRRHISDFEKDPDKDEKSRYVVRDLRRSDYIFTPTAAEMSTLNDLDKSIDISKFPSGFLINEPYMDRIKSGGVGPFFNFYGQNVTIVRDDLHQICYLMTTTQVSKGDELLWFYGYGYTCPRDYIVYAPEIHLQYRRLKNDRLITYDPKPQLPEWITKGGKSDKCVVATYTKHRGKEEYIDDYFLFTFADKDTKDCDNLPAMTNDRGLRFRYRVTRMSTASERTSDPKHKKRTSKANPKKRTSKANPKKSKSKANPKKSTESDNVSQ
jgi:hypothetical protein